MIWRIDLDGSPSFGEGLSYAWEWPGGTAEGVTPNLLVADGTYPITLTVTDVHEQTDVANDQVTVGEPPPEPLAPVIENAYYPYGWYLDPGTGEPTYGGGLPPPRGTIPILSAGGEFSVYGLNLQGEWTTEFHMVNREHSDYDMDPWSPSNLTPTQFDTGCGGPGGYCDMWVVTTGPDGAKTSNQFRVLVSLPT